MTPLILLVLQAAAASPPPPPPERFSILVDPCASARNDSGNDVVVCGNPEKLQPRIPLPRFRGPPDHAVPSNPDMRASTALNGPGLGNECGAYGEACPGIANGQALPVILGGAVDAVKSAFAKKPDKRGRVPIPLDDPAPGQPLPQ